MPSEIVAANQRFSFPKRKGVENKAIIGRKIPRQNVINKENFAFFKAVKKAENKIFNPINRYEILYFFKATEVTKVSVSIDRKYFTKF